MGKERFKEILNSELQRLDESNGSKRKENII